MRLFGRKFRKNSAERPSQEPISRTRTGLPRDACSRSAHMKKCGDAQSVEKLLSASQSVISARDRKALTSDGSVSSCGSLVTERPLAWPDHQPRNGAEIKTPSTPSATQA
jgi:hypothetical protein